MPTSQLRIAILTLVVGLTVAACGSDTAPASSTDATMADGMDMGTAEFAFGDPMEAASATQVIEITANDDFTFSPSNVGVTTGDTVTFRVTNAGAIPHDFTLGDEAMQDEHEAEMAEMGGDMAMHDEPNTMSLEPGETKEMTWHMTQPGVIIFGCHQTGHYAAGMKGTVLTGG